jgi:hypothetical protein
MECGEIWDLVNSKSDLPDMTTNHKCVMARPLWGKESCWQNICVWHFFSCSLSAMVLDCDGTLEKHQVGSQLLIAWLVGTWIQGQSIWSGLEQMTRSRCFPLFGSNQIGLKGWPLTRVSAFYLKLVFLNWKSDFH